MFVSGPLANKGVVLKGVNQQPELETSEVLHHLKSGSLDGFGSSDNGAPPAMIMGSKAALDAGLSVGSIVQVVNPQGTMTPFGPTPGASALR